MTSSLDRGLTGVEALGLIDRATLVDGGWQLSGMAARNQNFRLECHQGTGLFIKRATADTRDTLEVEAQFYSFCQSRPAVPGVAALMPVFHGFMEAEGVLVTELVAGAGTLFEDFRARLDRPPAVPRRSAVSPRRFAALGQALATLHEEWRPQRPGATQPPPGLPETPLSFLSTHRPGVDGLASVSPANHQLWKILQSRPELTRQLDALAEDWRIETVIHGDVRAENVLVVPGEAGERKQVRLVDWEFVRHGDPAWDVGSALAEFIRFWVYGMPHDADLTAEQREAAADYQLSALKPAMRALWESYQVAAGLGGQAAWNLLQRSVRLSALRLLRMAWEISASAKELSSVAVLFTQTAANVLGRPEAATESLFGLGRGSDL